MLQTGLLCFEKMVEKELSLLMPQNWFNTVGKQLPKL
jgi:hypothetical protein